MGHSIRLRLTRGTLVIAFMLLFALVFIAYQIGRIHTRSPQQQTDLRSTAKVTDLRHDPINGLLLRTSATNIETAPAPPSRQSGSSNATGSSPPSPSSAADPRIPGYNYYCLATMPPRYRSEAARAVAFLKRNRVDAAIIPVNNHWLQVVAIRGFNSTSSPQAREYESLLRSLGRAWKAEHRGWSDWSDLYAIKYKP